jgi:hypothetical protein
VTLRPSGNTRFREAYMHSIMQGEAIAAVDYGKVQVQDFELY